MIGGDLFSVFGMTVSSPVEEIDASYMDLRKSGLYATGDLRFAWKILRDPFIRHTYNAYRTVDAVIEAGFFDDGREPEQLFPEIEDPNWLTTPVHKITATLGNRAGNPEPPVILLTTGAFSPIHEGHLSMMEAAKSFLESRGRFVAGGYLSASHDSYVAQKKGIISPLDAPHRIRLIDMAVADSDWLMNDPWEAWYTPVPVTYTDVIMRLTRYLATHLPGNNFEIVYVFGSDNAGFVKGFVGAGACVCVSRPGYERQAVAARSDPHISANRHIGFSQYAKPESDVSSSSIIRTGNAASVPPAARDRYRAYTAPDRQVAEKKMYLLRDDASWATASWRTDRDQTRLDEALKEFKIKLAHTVRRALTACVPPDRPADIQVLFVDLAAQSEDVARLERETRVLNLDTCTANSSSTFHLSRAFGVCDGQAKPLHLVARPGHADIDTQLAAIPDGAYTLVEDDIASGTTIRKAMALLPARITASSTVNLLERYRRAMGATDSRWTDWEMLDICDTRDFIAGTRDAGLVVILDNAQPYRVPYALPYVSLSARATIPPSSERECSQAIWEMNVDLFRRITPAVLLSETDPSFRRIMEHIGFRPDTPMEDICRWHAQQLAVTAAP